MSDVVSRATRVAALAFLAALVWLASAQSAALAHGAGRATSSNFASEVSGLVATGGSPQATGQQRVADIAGLDWRVLGGDDYLRVTNTTGTQLVVLGYEREPYLRIGPDGVFENRHAPTTWLNRDRYADLTGVEVPDDVDASAAPDWVRVSTGTSYAWFDHRTQWMNRDERPEPVAAAPDRSHPLRDWVVAFELGGRALGVAGQLRWVPSGPAWPWPLLGLGLTALPLAGLALRRRSWSGRWQVAAAVVAVLAGVNAVQVADELLASRPVATVGELATVALPAAAAVGLALIGARRAWRRGRDGALSLVAGTAVLLVVRGALEVEVLSVSQVVARWLPTEAVKIVIGANLVAIVPLLALAVVDVTAGGPRDEAATPAAGETTP